MVLSLWIDVSYFPSETSVLLKLSNFNLEVCNALNELESVIRLLYNTLFHTKESPLQADTFVFCRKGKKQIVPYLPQSGIRPKSESNYCTSLPSLVEIWERCAA